MKYFLIAGEASGDLHASHLITALRERDAEADFRFYGGDLMEEAAGGGLLNHYRDLAYMGFVQVALHARTILRGLAACKAAIDDYRPDCIILIDYPGFNLKIARWVHEHWRDGERPQVFYYISPKIWAWKEHRIHAIRRYVDRMFSILPFEVGFYEGRHGWSITYVGNPSYDEVAAYLRGRGEDISDVATFGQEAPGRRSLIALLPGSRRQEIRANLSAMLHTIQYIAPRLSDRANAFPEEGRWHVAVSLAPGMDEALYDEIIAKAGGGLQVEKWRGASYDLLRQARAAMVTSGTATLETALLDVPQVVCYKMQGGILVNLLRPYFLKCQWISLVNLIANDHIVPEYIAAEMMPDIMARYIWHILADDETGPYQLEGYATVRQRLATPGAPQRTAEEIIARLKKHR